MSYDAVVNKNFKSVHYPFNADKQSTNPPQITPTKSEIPKAISENKVKSLNDTKTSDNAEKKLTDVTPPKPAVGVSAVETVKPDVTQMPDVSFIPQRWSRDLILHENDKPAILKTYNFQYKDKKFPGIVTDNTGKIYIYDRANGFHRPLKHLIRSGDDLSGYHAGFQEEQRKKNSHYFIDLGSLEVLQAALRSSVGGKYTVAIKEDDSFMTNWMRATSLDETEKFRYLNDNSVRLHSKATRNFYPLWLALGASLMIIPTTLMAISLANNGDLTPRDGNASSTLGDAGGKTDIGTEPVKENSKPTSDVEGKTESKNDTVSKGNVSSDVKDVAEKLKQIDIMLNDVPINDEVSKNNDPSKADIVELMKQIFSPNNDAPINDEVSKGNEPSLEGNNAQGLSDAGKKALIGTIPALGGIGLGVAGSTLYKNKNNKFVSEVNENLKLPENQYIDTLVSKPR